MVADGQWLTWLALTVLVVLAAGCLGADWWSPYEPTDQSPDRFAGSSLSHLFGTDELGRDLFARSLHGGRLTFVIAGGATLLAMLLGTIWGMCSAFQGGWLDEILMRGADTVMAIPQILFALVFVAAFDPTATKLAIVVGVLLTPTTARMVRSAVLSELQADYFAAAIAYGAPRRQLLLAEVLPNIRGPLAVQAAINGANAILLEASLSFVGLGIQSPQATWGSLVQLGYQRMYQSLEYMLFPAALIFVTIWMLNLLADQLGGQDPRGRAA
jgi:peptide/nickel transport system permease protein